MARRLSLIVAVLSLAGMTAASSAAALGIQSHRVAAAVPPAKRAAATTSGGELIASSAACPDQEDLGAPAADQEQTMTCMVNFARNQAGLGELADSGALAQSAHDKSRDILSCDSFSHFACGREFTYWMRATGYLSTPCWRVGENLAWGTGEYGIGAIDLPRLDALARAPRKRPRRLRRNRASTCRSGTA